MEESILTYKKKAGIFAAVIILADSLIRSVVNMLLSHFTATGNIDITAAEGYKTVNQLVGLGLSVFSIVFIFLLSYVFTKDKKKTVVFAGSIYFGKRAAGLIISLVSTVADCLSYTALINPGTSSAINTIGNIIALPIMIAAAYFAFTAFEGINSKLEGSLGKSGMLLKEAKKRYIIAYILAGIVAGVLSSAPAMIFALANYYDNNITLISQIIAWLGSVISFIILYRAGYKPYESHIDGMSFISVSGIAGAVSSLIISAVMLPVSTLMTSAISSENFGLVGILSAITSAASLIAVVVEILLIIYVIKFFFAETEISLFAEDIPESVTESEEFPSEDFPTIEN